MDSKEEKKFTYSDMLKFAHRQRFIMDKFEIKSKELEKVTIKVAVLQILALVITCFVGMWMTSKELYFEQIYIVPCYVIIIFGIVKLNNKWCDRIDAM